MTKNGLVDNILGVLAKLAVLDKTRREQQAQEVRESTYSHKELLEINKAAKAMYHQELVEVLTQAQIKDAKSQGVEVQAHEITDLLNKLSTEELEALRSKLGESKQLEISMTTDEAGMPVETTETPERSPTDTKGLKYNWPSHLLDHAQDLERIGLSPGPLAKHLVASKVNGELHLAFTASFYYEDESKLKVRREAYQALGKIFNKCGQQNIGCQFRRGGYLAVWGI